MRRTFGTYMIGIVAAALWAAVGAAQQPEAPKPTKEHEALKQFAGEWTMLAQTVPAPGQEVIKCEGTESAKMVGGFWLVGHGEGSMMGQPVGSVITIGYDPAAKKYVGTF